MATSPAHAREAGAEDYYSILGLQQGAVASEIRRCYFARALEHHPDRVVSTEAKELATTRFKLIREAYEVLSSPEQRRKYDLSRESGRPYVPQLNREAGELSLRDVFDDVDRFPFPQTAGYGVDSDLMSYFNSQATQSDSMNERVIATFSVADTDIAESTCTCVRGATTEVKGLLLSNFGIYVGVGGESTNSARFTMRYWYGTLTSWGRVARIELAVLSGSSDKFGMRVLGDGVPFSGVYFELRGSPAPFLWMASLYAIPVVPRLDLRVGVIAHQLSALLSILLCATAVMVCVWSVDGPAWAAFGPYGGLLVGPALYLAVVSVIRNAQGAALANLHKYIGA